MGGIIMKDTIAKVMLAFAASALIGLPAFAQDNIANPSDSLTISHTIFGDITNVTTVATAIEQAEGSEPGGGVFFSTASLNALAGLNGNSFLGADTGANFTNAGALVVFEPGTVTSLQVFQLNELFLTIGTDLNTTLTQHGVSLANVSDVVGITEGLETIPGTGPGTGPVHSLGFFSDANPAGTLPNIGLTGGGITFAIEGLIVAGQENRFLSQAATLAGYSASFVSDADLTPPPTVPSTGMSVSLLAIGIGALA